MTYLDDPNFGPAVKQILSDSLALPGGFLDYIVQYQALNGLPVPVGQLSGFTAFTPHIATVGPSSESTTSTTYTNLTSTGPQLVDLPPGKYLFLYGAQALAGVAGTSAFLAPEIGGTSAADADSAMTQTTVVSSTAAGTLKSLSSAKTTVTVKYRSDTGNSVTFLRRWLIGIKYANV